LGHSFSHAVALRMARIAQCADCCGESPMSRLLLRLLTNPKPRRSVNGGKRKLARALETNETMTLACYCDNDGHESGNREGSDGGTGNLAFHALEAYPERRHFKHLAWRTPASAVAVASGRYACKVSGRPSGLYGKSHPIFRPVGAGRGSGQPGARDKHAILDE